MIDDGFPAAGGHDDERIVPAEHGLNGFPLTAPEVGMAEALAQHGASAHSGCGSWHAGRKGTKWAGIPVNREP